MVKKIVMPCVISGQVSSFEFKIGVPAEGNDPITFQSKWLATTKQGAVPPYVIKALNDLQKISIETKVSLEDLCEMAFAKKNET